MSIVKRTVLSPWFKIVSSSILLLAAGVEIIEEITSELNDVSLGVHHGAFVFAIFHLLGTIGEIAYETTHIVEDIEKAT